MKNKYLLLGSITLLMAISACKKDPLDETPSGRINIDKTFADVNLARGYLGSVYNNLPDYFDKYYFFSTLACKSDEAADVDIGQNAFSSALWNNGQLSVSTNPLWWNNTPNNSNGFWPMDWAGIRLANVYIENVNNVPNMPDEEKRVTRGEAMAMRAYYYFELIKCYGGVPIVDRSLSSTDDFNSLSRNSFDECAQWIARQCDTAAQLMNDVVRRRNNDIGRATKAFALAVKSRTLLYNASLLNNTSNDNNKWKAAADAARQVLELADQGHYALFNDYYSMFIQQDKGVTDQNFKEIIFQLPRNNGHFNNVNSIAFGKGFKAGTCPSQELVDAYPMKNGEQPVLGYSDADKLMPVLNPTSGYDPLNPYENRDPRLTASIFYNGSFWGKQNGINHNVESFVGGSDGLREDRNYTRTGYYIKKYIDPTAGNGFANQAPASAQAYWIIFRLAEFYLNYAEALNEFSGPVTEVYTALNRVRARAGIANLPAALSKDQMRERIRNERRVELAFEEHRFYDVRRWKILKDTDKLVTGMRITKTGNALTYNRFVVERRLAWDDKYLQFPIPIDDLSKMTGVQQNPGW